MTFMTTTERDDNDFRRSVAIRRLHWYVTGVVAVSNETGINNAAGGNEA